MRRGTTTRGRAMVAAAWGVLVLAGCTATAEPEVEPTGKAVVHSTEPTPMSTPTPTPTVAPETIKPERPEYEVSDAGAEAFAEYFLMLYPYVYATGDLTEWTALGDPECVFCKSVADNVTAQVAAGNRSTGGAFTILEIDGRATSDDFYVVEADIAQEAFQEFGPDGSLIDSSTPSTPIVLVALGVRDAGWVVLDVQVDEAPQ